MIAVLTAYAPFIELAVGILAICAVYEAIFVK